MVISGIYAAMAIWLTRKYEPAITLTVLPESVCNIAGGILIAAGILFYTIAAIQLHFAYCHGELTTSGLYNVVRHPIYATFILLIAPGIAIISRSLALFALPIVMYLIFTVLVRTEENAIEARFGQDYRDYAKRVPLLFPRL